MAARKRRYLQLYFFEYHMGRGMPEVRCVEAALRVSSGDAATAGPELKATVPSENPLGELMDQMQQLQMLGRWHNPASVAHAYQRLPLPQFVDPATQMPAAPGAPPPQMQMPGAFGAFQQAPVQMPMGQWWPPAGGVHGQGMMMPYSAPGQSDQGGFEEILPAEQKPCAF